MLACWVSPETRTSVTVTNPSRGSLTRRSSISATMTLIRSAIFRTRGLLIAALSDLRGWVSGGPACRHAGPPLHGVLAARDLPHLEGLDDVALLDVVEA